MKKATNMIKVLLSVALVAFLVSGCLITEIIQSAIVAAGGVFEVKITITDKTADANAYKGALCILAPEDWEFVSGTYNSQVGTGAFELDPATPPLYGDIDAKLPPPAGMKWIRLLSDAAYTNDANVVHEATIKLKAGATTGTFPIGYLVTKNTVDMLGSINPLDIDNDNAWADTSMNHMVTVTGATAPAILLNEAYSRGTTADPDWVELYNHTDAEVDISAYKIYDNGGQAGTKPKMGFPEGTRIPPYGFYVVITDDKADPANFGLGSGGDKVWLEDGSGAVIDSLEFGAMDPAESFQRVPDGIGEGKMTKPITRGTSNVPVKLNEAYSRGTNENPDWVELYNSATDTVDISGWLVYDNGGQAGTKPKKVIPAGTLLLPKGYYVIVVDNTGDPSDFGLGSGGDKVWLENTTGAMVDSVEFGALTAAQSYSRIPDGGIWQIVGYVSRGASNSGAALPLVQDFEGIAASGDPIPGWIFSNAQTWLVAGYGHNSDKYAGWGEAANMNHYIQMPMVTNPGTLTFWIAGYNDATNLSVSVNISSDGGTWTELALFPSKGAGGDFGLAYFEKTVVIERQGSWFIRWNTVNHVDGGFYLDDVALTAAGGSVVGSNPAVLAESYILEQNYPNPFNPVTQISFYLPKAAQVNLTVYNLLGQAVREVVNTRLAAGSHAVTFDAADLKSGIYFYAIKTADFSATRRMVLIK